MTFLRGFDPPPYLLNSRATIDSKRIPKGCIRKNLRDPDPVRAIAKEEKACSSAERENAKKMDKVACSEERGREEDSLLTRKSEIDVKGRRND
jgi:hypothetical protein